MNPFMPKAETDLLYKYLNKAKYYFEFGSGGSTYQASLKENIKKIYTVENDSIWLKKLKSKVTNPNVNFIFVEMNIKNKSGGTPKQAGQPQHDKWIEYSHAFKNLKPDECKQIDTILVDGRFRVACALNCFEKMNDNAVILFDDFQNRKFYHEVLQYFDVVEKAGRMVVLKKKKGIAAPSEQILNKYEKISQ